MNPKPGYATTEWWTTLLTSALAVVAVLHPTVRADQWTPLANALAVVAAAAGAGIYSLSRSRVKIAAVTAAPPAPAPTFPTVTYTLAPSSTVAPVAGGTANAAVAPPVAG